jgi:hypothetical protein
MDTTDVLGRLLKLEGKIEKIFSLMDELMRDQTSIEKRLDKLEKVKRLKPPAEESSG